MPLDTSVFDKLKTFEDYNKADQTFQLQKATAAQALQTSDLDQKTKQLALAGQIVGNASTDQNSYDQARAFANSKGIDTSFLPDQFDPNVVSRLRFAGATPTAQLSALIASQGHQLKAGIATGDVGGYGYGGAPVMAPNAPPVVSTAAPAPKAQMTPDQQKTALSSLYDAPAVDAQPVTLSADASPQFSFRAQEPGETIDAYKGKQQQAFEQFKTNNAPAIKQAEKTAEKKGEMAATKEDNANSSSNTFDQLQQNIAALKQLSPQIPAQGMILSPEQSAGLSLRAGAIPVIGKNSGGSVGGADAANAIASYKEISEQQVINSLKQLVQGGQIRGNQFIEKIISRGSLAPIDGTDDKGRQQILDQLVAELGNANTNAQNQSANYNGGTPQSMQPIPVPQANSGIKFLGFK